MVDLNKIYTLVNFELNLLDKPTPSKLSLHIYRFQYNKFSQIFRLIISIFIKRNKKKKSIYNDVYLYSKFEICSKYTNLNQIDQIINNFELDLLHVISNIHPISTGPNIKNPSLIIY